MRIEDKKEEALRGCGGKPVRWGIMGTGRIAGIFCEALKALPQAEIYAVGSRTPAKARAFAGGCGAEKAYGSYEEFAADEKIDIVYVATPIACHYENVRLCLEAGRNVLCEKAFTQRAGEAVYSKEGKAQLKQQGLVDPDIFISRRNELAEQLRAAKLEKERFLEAEEDQTIQQTQELIEALEAGPDLLGTFDGELFRELVDKIIVESNDRLHFRLVNGLELTEPMERTVR